MAILVFRLSIQKKSAVKPASDDRNIISIEVSIFIFPLELTIGSGCSVSTIRGSMKIKNGTVINESIAYTAESLARLSSDSIARVPVPERAPVELCPHCAGYGCKYAE